MQVLHIQQIKNQSLLADFSILQTCLFLHVINDDQHALCYGGKVSTKLHVRYKCHIWIQYRLYITILMFLIYVYNMSIMFRLHPQSWHNWLETFHFPKTLQVLSNLIPITQSRINPQQNKNQPPLAELCTTNQHQT